LNRALIADTLLLYAWYCLLGVTADAQVKQSKWDEALDLLDEGVLRAACIFFTSVKSLMVAKSSSKTNENITVCFLS
jgi:hypothetical protein